MANRITVSICGEEYTLVAEESTAYMEQVASLVDKKMSEVITGATVGRNDAAVLAAVNLADEYRHCVQDMGFTREDLGKMLVFAAEAAFLPEEEKQKLITRVKEALS